jgi:hypothetical protein
MNRSAGDKARRRARGNPDVANDPHLAGKLALFDLLNQRVCNEAPVVAELKVKPSRECQRSQDVIAISRPGT